MKILNIAKRDNELVDRLWTIWRRSVEMTHTFLTNSDINNIAQYVPAAIKEIPVLLVAEIEGNIVGFAGVDQQKLEMLFFDPDVRGQGNGRQLVNYLIRNHRISEVCVNEQNPQAKGFYEYMGFQVYRRTSVDEQGNPFPLLYMKR